MKEKLQNAFKPAPERFRYTVSEAAHEATSLPSPGCRRPQVRVLVPRAPLPPLVPLPAAHGLGLTVWAAVAALLARRGGRAMGEGGPVPTPLRGAPAPSPGEA